MNITYAKKVKKITEPIFFKPQPAWASLTIKFDQEKKFKIEIHMTSFYVS